MLPFSLVRGGGGEGGGGDRGGGGKNGATTFVKKHREKGINQGLEKSRAHAKATE